MLRLNQILRTLSCLSVIAMLTACGGGSSSTTTNTATNPVSLIMPADKSVTTQDPISFTASANTTTGTISKMSWSVEKITLDAESLAATSNADCKTISLANGGADASCTITVTPPSKLSADYYYRLTMTATNNKGNTVTNSIVLTVKKDASASNSPTVKITADTPVSSGDKVNLSCAGSGGTPAEGDNPYSYQWVVSDAKGLAINIADTSIATTSFVAPVVTTATTVKVECRVTDSKPKVGTSTANIVINPVVLPTVVPIVTGGGIVSAGSVINLDGSATKKFDAKGNSVVDGKLYFFWKQKSGDPVVVYNPFSSIASVSLPKTVTQRTAFVFTLSVSTSQIFENGASTDPIKTVDLVYYVDPLPTIPLVSYTPIQSVTSGSIVTLRADTPGYNNALPVYFQWVLVSSFPTPITIAGSTTSSAGFIAPTVTEATQLVFRVSVGYTPNPTSGTSIDVVVLVKP